MSSTVFCKIRKKTRGRVRTLDSDADVIAYLNRKVVLEARLRHQMTGHRLPDVMKIEVTI